MDVIGMIWIIYDTENKKYVSKLRVITS